MLRYLIGMILNKTKEIARSVRLDLLEIDGLKRMLLGIVHSMLISIQQLDEAFHLYSLRHDEQTMDLYNHVV